MVKIHLKIVILYILSYTHILSQCTQYNVAFCRNESPQGMDASDRNLLSVFTPQSFFDDSPTLARNNHSSTLDSASESY